MINIITYELIPNNVIFEEEFYKLIEQYYDK